VDLVITETTLAGRLVLSACGEIDMATLPQLHSALGRAVSVNPGCLVVLDVDGVDAFDDTALGVVLGAAGRARDFDGDIVLVCSAGPLRERLARTGFDRAVRVSSSLAGAAAAAGAMVES
jgi:anti-anti-sigma factor